MQVRRRAFGDTLPSKLKSVFGTGRIVIGKMNVSLILRKIELWKVSIGDFFNDISALFVKSEDWPVWIGIESEWRSVVHILLRFKASGWKSDIWKQSKG